MTMQRRKLLIGLGSAVGAGAVGTGAFTSVSAERDVTVQVADDANALLGIETGNGPNAEAFAETTDDETVALNLSGTDTSGSGLGTDSTYQFDDILRLTNQGTQTVYAWVTFDFSEADDDLTREDVYFYPQSNPERALNNGENSVVTLPVGESVSLGLLVDTEAVNGEQSLSVTINADVSVPGGSQPRDGSGEDAAVVTENPDDGEFNSIQSAVDKVDGTTVFVESGTFEESVAVEKPVTIRGTTDPAGGQAATVVGQGSDTFTVQSNDVTITNLDIRNPTGGSRADPESFSGAIGVNVESGNTGVSVVNNVITELGTENDDANPMAVYAQGATSGITVENNLISRLEGTDEDAGAVQAVQINSQRGQRGVSDGIDDARVVDNTITDVLDTRSAVAVRFNGDVSGEIVNNTISDLNTEGDIPGTNDPGGFTQVLALSQGGNSPTGPSGVTVEDNTISNIETTTPGNFAPPVHLIVTESASNISVADNTFSADSPDVEQFVLDAGGVLDLAAVAEANVFEPSVQVTEGVLYPGDLRLVSGGGSALQDAIDAASSRETLAVEASEKAYDAVSIGKSLTIQSVFSRPTIEATEKRVEVSASDVRFEGFDIDLQNGNPIYVNPGNGLVFRNNEVSISETSPHGIRIDAAGEDETVVSNNVFNQSESKEDNPQAILFSDGSNYRIENNVLNGNSKGQAVLVSTQGNSTTEFDILNNDIKGWETPLTLFENPSTGDIDDGLISGNEISNGYTGDNAILAFEEDGDGFGDLNGESEPSEQETALSEDNGGVPVSVEVGSD